MPWPLDQRFELHATLPLFHKTIRHKRAKEIGAPHQLGSALPVYSQ